jgi:hypothetical protein
LLVGTRFAAALQPRIGRSHSQLEVNVGISLSLILAAAGAVLLWAVDATVAGLNIHTVGVILLVVGIIGFVTSLFFLSSWGGFGGSRDTTVVHDRVVEQ